MGGAVVMLTVNSAVAPSAVPAADASAAMLRVAGARTCSAMRCTLCRPPGSSAVTVMFAVPAISGVMESELPIMLAVATAVSEEPAV